MNIFILSYNPNSAARMLCDQHIVKMPLETAQILCSAYPSAPYRRTHFNHPCSIWARSSKKNYLWLVNYGLALCREFTFRYQKKHKAEKVMRWCKQNIKRLDFPLEKKTHYVLCMPSQYVIGSAIDSYRNYYRNEKVSFARYRRGRKAPNWL